MTIFYWFVSLTLLLLSVLPLAMVIANLKIYRTAVRRSDEVSAPDEVAAVSVLIPARNESTSIGKSVGAILNSDFDRFEVIVLDDHSTDDTAEIVEGIANTDSRVRLCKSEPLPDGWNGKQFACWQLANLATHDYFLFLDADVRLTRDALGRIVDQQSTSSADLLSGFPFQETGSLAEKLLIPLMHLVLLGYLPLARSRSTNDASMAAGCGQLFYTTRQAYFAADGHRQIASSRHDGIQLPRAYRKRQLRTDLFDASDIATCRMYEDLPSVMRGLLKNAHEGIANPRLIIPFTVLLLGAFVLPLAMAAHALFWSWPLAPTVILCIAALVSFVPRALIAKRLESTYLGTLLNPIAVIWFVAIQWIALVQHSRGSKVAWRGRQS